MRLEKDIKYTVIALLFFVFEATCGKYIEIKGAVPMITLCFCVVASCMESDMSYAITIGLILGLVSDLSGGHGFGTYTVAFCAASFVSCSLKDSIFSSKLLFLLLDIFILTVLIQLFYRVTHIYDIGTAHFWYNLKSVVLPMALYNMVICLIYYPIHKKIFVKRGALNC